MKARKNQERGLERVSHLFLSGSEPAVEKETVTIQVAARTLGVSKGTIITYLNKGVLTRIKKDGAIYIEMDEVKKLGESKKELSLTSSAHTFSESARGASGLMTRDQSKEILSNLGQLEKEGQGQPATAREGKRKEFERLKSELDTLRQNLAVQSSELAEAKMRIKQLEKNQQEWLFHLNRAKDSDDHSPGGIRHRLLAVEEE
jgi:chromosome segregation ATPase